MSVTGKASLCMSQTIPAVCTTLNRPHRHLFPRTIISCADKPQPGAIAWNPPQ